MKRINVMKTMLALLLVLAFGAFPPSQVLAAKKKAVQPSIKILKVLTLNNEKEPQAEFSLWHPILFGIKYEIKGEENTRYKVKGFVKAKGKIMKVKQKKYPGVHRMVTALLVPGHVRPGEKLIKYMVKLKGGGELLDKDTATSKVTILPPNPNLGYVRLFQKDPADWSVVKGGPHGLLRYTLNGLRFVFHFDGHDLTPYTSYTLIYYPDPWPGAGLICLGRGTTNYHGDLLNLTGMLNIQEGLPLEADGNYPDGAKIWLVLSEDVDCSGKMMVHWDPEEYLFEENLITYESMNQQEGSGEEIEEPLKAAMRIRPRTLNLSSKGKWMRCFIKPPEGHSVNDIDLNALLALGEWVTPSQVKPKRNYLALKFDRVAVQDLIEAMGLKYPARVELKLTGKLRDGTPFEGSDVVGVKK